MVSCSTTINVTINGHMYRLSFLSGHMRNKPTHYMLLLEKTNFRMETAGSDQNPELFMVFLKQHVLLGYTALPSILKCIKRSKGDIGRPRAETQVRLQL